MAVGNIDRLLFVGLFRFSPKALDALKILKPETVLRWHRAGFRAYWRWKSRSCGGRPKAPVDIRQLIREMSVANPLWGAPRIHGELLKLGIDIGQTTVAKYMAKRRQPPSQGWKTFLRNHADAVASIDLFVIPTISFRLLYGFLVLRHSRREILWLGVTTHPSAEWIARQLTEACAWSPPPRYIIVIAMAHMAVPLSGVLEPWAYGIGRFRLGHPGKMDTPRGSSVPFGEIAWIMSLSSVSSIFVTCSVGVE